MKECESYRNLLEDVQRQDDLPDSVDAWRQGFLRAHEAPEFVARLNSTLSTREAVMGHVASPSHIGNFVLRHSHHKRLIGETVPYEGTIEDEDFDNSLTDASEWAEAIYAAIMHPSTGAEFMIRDVTSNIPSRYLSVKSVLSAAKFRQRFGEPKIMDIGCSRNLGLKKIAKNDVFDPVVTDSDDSPGLDALNEHAGESLSIARGTGVDKWTPSDGDDHTWSYACTFPFYDLDKKRMSEFNELSAYKHDGIDFIQASPAMGWEKFQKHASLDVDLDEYDAVSAITMLYQQHPDSVRNILDVMNSVTHKNGILIVQDFGEIHGDEFVSTDSWYESGQFPYRTLVYDKAKPEDGFVEWYQWSSGRCREVRVSEHAARELEA